MDASWVDSSVVPKAHYWGEWMVAKRVARMAEKKVGKKDLMRVGSMAAKMAVAKGDLMAVNLVIQRAG
jgi:hypothetical protein